MCSISITKRSSSKKIIAKPASGIGKYIHFLLSHGMEMKEPFAPMPFAYFQPTISMMNASTMTAISSRRSRAFRSPVGR